MEAFVAVKAGLHHFTAGMEPHHEEDCPGGCFALPRALLKEGDTITRMLDSMLPDSSTTVVYLDTWEPGGYVPH